MRRKTQKSELVTSIAALALVALLWGIYSFLLYPMTVETGVIVHVLGKEHEIDRDEDGHRSDRYSVSVIVEGEGGNHREYKVDSSLYRRLHVGSTYRTKTGGFVWKDINEATEIEEGGYVHPGR